MTTPVLKGATLDDEALMRLALDEAVAAETEGEAPIGAVVYDPASGEIVARAHNQPIGLHDPTGHAEILALRAAAKARGNYRLTGLTLAVTLEPCAMCAGAISHARIGRLVYGASDAKGGAVESGGRFFEQPTCHSRPEVTPGVLAEESAAMLRSFFKARRGTEPTSQPRHPGFVPSTKTGTQIEQTLPGSAKRDQSR